MNSIKHQLFDLCWREREKVESSSLSRRTFLHEEIGSAFLPFVRAGPPTGMMRLSVTNDQLCFRAILLLLIDLVDFLGVMLVTVGLVETDEMPGDRRRVDVVNETVEFDFGARLDGQLSRLNTHRNMNGQMNLHRNASTTIGNFTLINAFVRQTNVVNF